MNAVFQLFYSYSKESPSILLLTITESFDLKQNKLSPVCCEKIKVRLIKDSKVSKDHLLVSSTFV